MRKSCFFLLLFLSNIALARQWEVHIAGGLSTGKLVSRSLSTPATPQVRYGLHGMGSCFSPEVALNVDGHSRFTLAYQLSFTPLGFQYRPEGRRGPSVVCSDVINVQSIMAGYSWSLVLERARLQLGFYGKAGMAHSSMFGIEGGSSSGMNEMQQGYYASGRRLTGFEVMPDFWSPVSTVGVIFGPAMAKGRLADRLTFNIWATLLWKDPYTSYSVTEYTYISGPLNTTGRVQCKGNPLMFQLCADYNLFRFRNKEEKL